MKNKNRMGASSLREDRAGGLRPEPRAASQPIGARPIARAKIRLWINHAHVARVLEIKRALCVGEEVRAA